VLHEATKEVAKGNFDIKVDRYSDDEVGELAESFNKMTAELKSMEMLQKDFISNVSHEFKTPISSIQGFAELMKSGRITDEERREYAEIISAEAERLSKLTSNILKLSKLENQDTMSERNLFSLDEQIRRVILLLEPEWNKKNIQFDLHLNDIMFYGNEELLQQVWLNLLDNAIKFSHRNGKIIVQLYHTGTSIKAKVMDRGIGMDDRTRERIFDKFYQGDTTRASEGNGLGLALVKRIVELSGGKIDVESRRGKGSTFTIVLPD
jgi:signal transduction histidine kinase